MANRVSRQTYKALRAFAKAVRAVTDIYDQPSPDSNAEYLAREYLPEMTSMLKDQLVTVVGDQSIREDILTSAGLDYMCEDVAMLAQELDMEG